MKRLLIVLLLVGSALGQKIEGPRPDAANKGWRGEVTMIADKNSESSRTVAADLHSKFAASSNLFTLNDSNDSMEGLIVIPDCLPRTEKTGPFVCYYTAFYFQGKAKTLIGAAAAVKTTSAEVADFFFASIAQDILDNWNKAIRAIAITRLEGCVILTQSRCEVPELLKPDFKTETINLLQYLTKGPLN